MRIQKAIFFPSELVERIEEFQKNNYVVSFTAAVILLVSKALEKEGEK